MDSIELREYEEKELEITERYRKEFLNGAKKLGQIPIEELARRAYSDKFIFKELVFFHQQHAVPLKLLLVFSEQVIVFVNPYKKNADFQRAYGMTAEEMAEKYTKCRILPIILWRPSTEFVGEFEDNYMDPLLKLRPPTDLRRKAFLDAASGGKMDEYLKKGREVVGTHLDILQTCLSDESGETLSREQLNMRAVSAYYNLRCLGFNSLVDELELLTPEEFLCLLTGYHHFLAEPYLYGLGAQPQLTRDKASLGRALGLVGIERYKFPLEVGRFIADKYQLIFPHNIEMHTVDKIYADTTAQKARSLLTALYQRARELHGEEGPLDVAKIQEAFLEAAEALPSVDKTIEKAHFILHEVAPAAICLLAEPAKRLIGVLASLGLKVTSRRVAMAIGRLRYGPLPLSLWQFQKEYKRFEESSAWIRQKRGTLKP